MEETSTSKEFRVVEAPRQSELALLSDLQSHQDHPKRKGRLPSKMETRGLCL
jgi:hypothetical protein